MADGASFWAKKSEQVKSASSPNPTITHPLKLTEALPQKKGLVLTAATNGTTNDGSKNFTTVRKKIDWADDDGDEDFYSSFNANFKKEDPRIATLEASLAVKDECVKELQTKLASKHVRIGELEGTVQEKQNRIDVLEEYTGGQDSQIEHLKEENHEQYLRMQELVAEVDEKDRRIAALKVELDKKGAVICHPGTIHDTGSQSQESDENGVEHVKDNEPIKEDDTGKEDFTTTKDQDTQAAVKPIDELTDVKAAPSEGKSVTSAPSSPSTEAATEKTSSRKDLSGPKFNNTEFPTFLTPETLKVVPPSPMPKKMVFPNDKFFSKLDKKSTDPTTKPLVSSKGKDGLNPTWGQTSKKVRVKTDVVPQIQPYSDIRHMPHAERVLYANGPEVEVKMGDVKLAVLPMYILMQCSSKAYKHFTDDPKATNITFPANSMDMDAAKAHCNWMDEMTYQGRVYSITLNTEPKFNTKNLKICRAARVMGLNNAYVGHFTKQLCDRIRNQEATSEFVELVCELAYPDNDPIFDCLANNLVNQRRSDASTAKYLETLAAKYEVLQKKVEQIEKRFGGRKRNCNPSREASKSRDGSKDRKDRKGATGLKAEKDAKKYIVVR